MPRRNSSPTRLDKLSAVLTGAKSMLTEMSDAQLLEVVALDIDRAQI